MSSIALPVDRSQVDERRFWNMVRRGLPDECWEWRGRKSRKGYGTHQNKKVRILAHRASYALNVAPVPAGLLVLHKCDNPPCCNPAHLFLGTNEDNMRDCAEKGRQRVNVTRRYSKASLNELARRLEAGEVTQRCRTIEPDIPYSYVSVVARRPVPTTKDGSPPRIGVRSLTGEQVAYIKAVYADRKPGGRLPYGAQLAIARHLGIPKYLVNDVARGATYCGSATDKESC